MVRIELQLPPEQANVVWEAMRAALDSGREAARARTREVELDASASAEADSEASPEASASAEARAELDPAVLAAERALFARGAAPERVRGAGGGGGAGRDDGGGGA